MSVDSLSPTNLSISICSNRCSTKLDQLKCTHEQTFLFPHIVRACNICRSTVASIFKEATQGTTIRQDIWNGSECSGLTAHDHYRKMQSVCYLNFVKSNETETEKHINFTNEHVIYEYTFQSIISLPYEVELNWIQLILGQAKSKHLS